MSTICKSKPLEFEYVHFISQKISHKALKVLFGLPDSAFDYHEGMVFIDINNYGTMQILDNEYVVKRDHKFYRYSETEFFYDYEIKSDE